MRVLGLFGSGGTPAGRGASSGLGFCGAANVPRFGWHLVGQLVGRSYPQAIALCDDPSRPVCVDMPFRNATIPGYLRIQPPPGRPVILCINGIDNLKETEQHTVSKMLYWAEFSTVIFDGPGQGEMHSSVKMIPDYESAAAAVIDWLEANDDYRFDVTRAPAMDRPLLIFHSGGDRPIPHGKRHADTFMAWASGDEELRFYERGEHVCANRLDEVLPYNVDWFPRHLQAEGPQRSLSTLHDALA